MLLDANLLAAAERVGVTRASQFRYEAGQMVPDTGIMLKYLRVAVEQSSTYPVASAIADTINERSGITPFAAVLAVLLSTDGPLSKGASIPRLAKRAAEILEAAGK